MTKQTQAVTTKREDKVMEYVPFGAKESIKLTVAIVINLICVPTKSGKRCSENEAIKFMMMCQARALNPFEGDAFLIGYDNRDGGATFSLITAHQAFLKRAELNPEYDGMESGIIFRVNDEPLQEREGDFHEEDETVVGGWCKVFFKNRSKPMYRRIRMSRFKKSFGIWVEDAAGMIVKCAEADALRSSFPTMLGGLYLREEVMKDDGPKVSAPIFTAPTEVPITKLEDAKPKATAKPKAEPTASAQAPEIKIAELCKSDDILEADLIMFLQSSGLADDDASKVADLSDETMDAVINQWSDFRDKIREELS